MEATKKEFIQKYLDQNGFKKVTGYYLLEAVIQESMAQPWLNCHELFERALQNSELKGYTSEKAYSVTRYALRTSNISAKDGKSITMLYFIRSAADEIKKMMPSEA